MPQFIRVSAAVLMLIIACIGGVPSATHAAAPQRVIIDARVGFDNTYFADSWTPVTITIAGGTAPQDVRVEWVVTADSQPTITWQRDLRIDPATPTSIDTVMVLPSYARSIIARVRADGSVIASTQIDAQVAPGPINLVVADTTTVGTAFRNTTKEDGLTGVVRVIPPAHLPSAVTALQGVNTILIGDTAQLSPAQFSALRLWVGLGGRLAISGAAPAALADIAAFVPGTAPVQTGAAPTLPSGVRPLAVDPHPAASAMHSDTTLLWRRDIGRGQFIQSALSLADTDGWSGQYWYWQPVLAGTINAYAATMTLPVTSAIFDPFITSLTVPAIQQPAPWLLFVIAVVYILLVGPVTYLVLKRRNQLDRAWVTIPITAALVTVALIGGVYLSRGTSPRLYGLRILQQDAASPTAYSATTVGIYAPFRTTFTVTAPDSLTLQHLSTSMPGSAAGVAAVDATVAVPATIGSMQFVTSSAVQPAPVSVSHTLVRRPDLLHGTFRVQGVTLQDAYLQIGSFAQALGTVAPDQDIRIDITQDTPQFPCAIPSADDVLSTQRVYEHITGPCGAVNAQLDGRAVLYGWMDQADAWPTVSDVPYTAQRQLVIVTLNIP